MPADHIYILPILKSFSSFFQVKNCLDLGAWGLENTFGPLGPRRHIKP